MWGKPANGMRPERQPRMCKIENGLHLR
jgi:hypothetical protein